MKETDLPRDEVIDESFLREDDPAKVMVTAVIAPPAARGRASS
jgi:hypothetical protein